MLLIAESEKLDSEERIDRIHVVLLEFWWNLDIVWTKQVHDISYAFLQLVHVLFLSEDSNVNLRNHEPFHLLEVVAVYDFVDGIGKFRIDLFVDLHNVLALHHNLDFRLQLLLKLHVYGAHEHLHVVHVG